MYREYPTFQPDELLEYLRKSRSDDASLTVEEVLARHEAELLEWQERNLPSRIKESNIYREVVSGESIAARSEFRKLLKRIESPKVKAVLVRDCSRLGRPDLEEIGRITKIFRYTKTLVITPHKTFDLNDEWDRESFQRELMRSSEYLDQSRFFLSSGRERSIRSGFFAFAVVPYGYKKAWIYEGKRERPTLEILEDEAKVVRLIFDWYANEGIGATKICQRLNAMGIPSRKGTIWKKSSIVHIIKNEHYIGKVVIKKHIDVKTVEDSVITSHCVFNPDYEVIDGKHPAIIDEDLFNRANNKIRRYPSVKPNKTLQNPYASILKCECGRVMIRRPCRKSDRYLCDEQTICKNASIYECELTPAIIQGLKEHLADLQAKVTDTDDNKKEKHLANVSLLESRYVEIEKKEISLWDKYTEEKMPKQVFDKLMADCLAQKQNLENAIEQAYNNAPEQVDYKGVIASLHDAIEALSDDSVSASAKNKLLLSCVDKIVYRREKPKRMTKEEALAKGLKPNKANGVYAQKFELDIQLKL